MNRQQDGLTGFATWSQANKSQLVLGNSPGIVLEHGVSVEIPDVQIPFEVCAKGRNGTAPCIMLRAPVNGYYAECSLPLEVDDQATESKIMLLGQERVLPISKQHRFEKMLLQGTVVAQLTEGNAVTCKMADLGFKFSLPWLLFKIDTVGSASNLIGHRVSCGTQALPFDYHHQLLKFNYVPILLKFKALDRTGSYNSGLCRIELELVGSPSDFPLTQNLRQVRIRKGIVEIPGLEGEHEIPPVGEARFLDLGYRNVGISRVVPNYQSPTGQVVAAISGTELALSAPLQVRTFG